MNVHDTEKLAGNLEEAGYLEATTVQDADVVLLNTCSIREKAAEKVFSELGRLRLLKRKRPGMILGVCGCVGQQEGEEIFGTIADPKKTPSRLCWKGFNRVKPAYTFEWIPPWVAIPSSSRLKKYEGKVWAPARLS